MGELLSVSLSIVDQFMKSRPDYEQKKNEKFYKLWRKWENERKKVYQERDDELLANLADELRGILKVFHAEISSAGL